MSKHLAQRLMAFAVKAEAAESLEIVVYDVIGKDIWGDGISAGDFVAKLRSAPKAKAIDLRVNSLGGLVNDAKAMIALLGERAAAGVKTTGHVDGIAASSAAYLLTGCSFVRMAANAFVMVHGVRGRVFGTASDLEAASALMRAENELMAEAFAAASERRGKGKSKDDFLKAFAAGDLYLTADEAIEWGLADEKVEALKVAASLVDLSERQSAPEALRAAPFACTAEDDPRLAALLQAQSEPPKPQPTPAGLGAQLPLPNIEARNTPMTISKVILTALALSEDADEAAVVSAVNKLKVRAQLGSDVEQLLGVPGQSALGAVRALKESSEANAELGTEVAKLKIVNVRRDFDALIAKGVDPKAKKLSPAVAKLYAERFEAAVKLAEGEQGDADAASEKATGICDDLRGFLAVAPRIIHPGPSAPQAGGGGGAGEGQTLQHNGKSFEAMTGSERHALKGENVDLYNLMRDDALERGAV